MSALKKTAGVLVGAALGLLVSTGGATYAFGRAAGSCAKDVAVETEKVISKQEHQVVMKSVDCGVNTFNTAVLGLVAVGLLTLGGGIAGYKVAKPKENTPA